MTKRTFIIYCRDCEELFKPEGKFSKVCEKCKCKARKERRAGAQPKQLNKPITPKI